MALTKKDYIVIANALRSQREHMTEDFDKEVEDLQQGHVIRHKTWQSTVETLAATFALVHDNFKSDVFLKAAGVLGGSNADTDHRL